MLTDAFWKRALLVAVALWAARVLFYAGTLHGDRVLLRELGNCNARAARREAGIACDTEGAQATCVRGQWAERWCGISALTSPRGWLWNAPLLRCEAQPEDLEQMCLALGSLSEHWGALHMEGWSPPLHIDAARCRFAGDSVIGTEVPLP